MGNAESLTASTPSSSKKRLTGGTAFLGKGGCSCGLLGHRRVVSPPFFFFGSPGPLRSHGLTDWSGTLSRNSKKLLIESSALAETSRFTPNEVEWLGMFWNTRFAGKAPSCAEVLRSFPGLGEHEQLMGQLFRVLDRNVNGALDLEEFVHGCSVAGRGTLDQKLAFLFVLFDADEDRIVSRSDVRDNVRLISRFMVRDGRLAARVYARDEVLEIFHGAETLLLDRFKQRAVSNTVVDNCLRFFEAVFFPVLQLMESDLRSAQLFDRPLTYIVLREDNFVPALVTAAGAHLVKRAGDLGALFQVRMDDERCLKLAQRVEAAWMDLRLSELLQDLDDVTVVAALLKKFLNDLPEPLFPFVLYSELLAAKGQAALEAVVKQVPPIHFATLGAVVNLVRTLSAGRAADCDKLCLVLGPLLMRPKKVDEDNEVRVRDAKTVARVLRTIATEDMLAALDAEKALLRDAEKKLADARRDLTQAREDLSTAAAQLSAAKLENSALVERMGQQAASTQKMAVRLADLRQELTAAKMEAIASPTPSRAASASAGDSASSTPSLPASKAWLRFSTDSCTDPAAPLGTPLWIDTHLCSIATASRAENCEVVRYLGCQDAGGGVRAAGPAELLPDRG